MTEPLEHTHKGVRYTCAGAGLLKDGHAYDAHAEKFLPLRNGAAAHPVEKKLVAWWKAQCAFRGLNQTGAINDLQLRLREAKATMLSELKTAQTELNRQYKKNNKTTESWAKLKTVEQKARADPERFLAEAFPRGATGRPANLDLVVVKLQDHPALADGAESLGLERVSVDAPWISGKKPSPDRWLIIGRHRDAVWNQMQEIQRETLRSKQSSPAKSRTPAQAEEPNAPPKKKQAAKKSTPVGSQVTNQNRPSFSAPAAQTPIVQSSPKPRTKQTAIRPKPFASSGASFTNKPAVPKNTLKFDGLYKISCPQLEGEWPSEVELTLNIIFHNSDNTPRQMYAEFDFGLVKGFMRFEKPMTAVKPEPASHKRKREEDLDEQGDMQMLGADDSKYNSKVFNLTAKDEPTVRRPTWRYRWRGRDTSESQIQLGSDKAVETITFEKVGKLSGMFSCDFARRCAFTGIQMETSKLVYTGGPPYIDQSWDSLSQETHSYEEKSRWGGSAGYRGW